MFKNNINGDSPVPYLIAKLFRLPPFIAISYVAEITERLKSQLFLVQMLPNRVLSLSLSKSEFSPAFLTISGILLFVYLHAYSTCSVSVETERWDDTPGV